MDKKRKLGLIKSKITGNELIFSFGNNMTLPTEYSYKSILPSVLNQGSSPICVPCTISAYINWKLNLKDGSKKDNKIKLLDIFKANQNNNEGMTFKEAFNFLKEKGVDFDGGHFTIKQYGMIKSVLALKYAIIMNGPCFGALPVYNSDSDEFWLKRGNDSLEGFHAISIVGYNKNGFIIRNSWGKSFGNNGYVAIKYEDINKFVELWTVIK